MPLPIDRQLLPLAAIILSMLFMLFGVAFTPAAYAKNEAVKTQLIVGFRDEQSSEKQARVLRSAGAGKISGRSVSKQSIKPLRAVTIPVSKKNLPKVRARLLARKDVAYVEIDHIARAYNLAKNDYLTAPAPSGENNYFANDLGFSEQWALPKMGVTSAWEKTRGHGLKVAVLDTGVDYVHSDLQGQVIKGRDFIGKDTDPMDEQGHGTHIAGVIAAKTGNALGIAGIAPDAQILAVRVLNGTGEGNYSAVANGIIYAADQGAKVINLSLGGDEKSQILESALLYATAKGAIVTCATGNEAVGSVGYPAGYDSCLAVGATDYEDGLAHFSNTGTGIDMVAPGVQILSTTLGGGYEAWDGTSMATPQVSGAAALLFAQGLTRSEVVNTLKQSAVDLGARGYDKRFGHGRVNIAAATERGATLAANRGITTGADGRTLRSTGADTARPVIRKAALLSTKKRVKTTWKTSWKVSKKTKWRRVGVLNEPGDFKWQKVKNSKNKRTVSSFKTANGIVFQQDTTQIKKRVAKRSTTKIMRISYSAQDDTGIDRVALAIDGRMRLVNWSAKNNGVLQLACQSGRRKFTLKVYDAADNETVTNFTKNVRC